MKRLIDGSLPVVPAGKWAGVFLAALALLLVFLVVKEEPAAAARWSTAPCQGLAATG